MSVRIVGLATAAEPGVRTATLLIANIAKARNARRDLLMVISSSPYNDLIERGIDFISSMGFDNQLIQQIILVVLI